MPTAAGFRDKLVVRVENLSAVLLLPVFFAFTGLRTQVGLLNRRSGVGCICLIIIAVATAGKARWKRRGGPAYRDELARSRFNSGALMNTRGLMELIALNIGYDMGILSQRIFTMLVIMALVTTVMTGPLVTLFGKARQGQPSRKRTEAKRIMRNLPRRLVSRRLGNSVALRGRCYHSWSWNSLFPLRGAHLRATCNCFASHRGRAGRCPPRRCDPFSIPTILAALAHNASTGLSRLILQLAIILSVSSAVGWAFAVCGQPGVRRK